MWCLQTTFGNLLLEGVKMKAKVIIKGQCCSKPQDYFFEGEMPQIAVEIMKLLMMVDLPD